MGWNMLDPLLFQYNCDGQYLYYVWWIFQLDIVYCLLECICLFSKQWFYLWVADQVWRYVMVFLFHAIDDVFMGVSIDI